MSEPSSSAKVIMAALADIRRQDADTSLIAGGLLADGRINIAGELDLASLAFAIECALIEEFSGGDDGDS